MREDIFGYNQLEFGEVMVNGEKIIFCNTIDRRLAYTKVTLNH